MLPAMSVLSKSQTTAITVWLNGPAMRPRVRAVNGGCSLAGSVNASEWADGPGELNSGGARISRQLLECLIGIRGCPDQADDPAHTQLGIVGRPGNGVEVVEQPHRFGTDRLRLLGNGDRPR